VYDSTRGTIQWKADLLFAIGSDVVKNSSIDALQGFTQVIMSPAAADFEVLVVGHTDSQRIVRTATKAKHPTNWHLSAHRAIAVAFALQKYGYPAGRAGVMGYGEYRPVADNATEAGKSQNRRVEIYLVPRGAIVQASAGAGWKIDGQTVAVVPLSP
jgi:chemotaxis protein MotB